MKRICLLTITMQFVTCITTDSTTSLVTQQPTTPSLKAPLEPPNEVATSIPPVVSAHQKTEAPMLGYIFDTHSNLNKHHHHDHKWGPHFEEVELGANATNMTVQVGNTANLNCRISFLQDKTRKLWIISIENIIIMLKARAPEVMIVDEEGRPLQDKYYEAESTIQLSCIVRHVAMTSSVVSWLHGDRTLNYDTTRGGISVKTDLMEEGANSSLSVARVNKTDSGNYTCSISPTEYATITVHVLNGGRKPCGTSSRQPVSGSTALRGHSVAHMSPGSSLQMSSPQQHNVIISPVVPLAEPKHQTA
ncbi:uncharacterized protein LOC110834119 [Zootermopsis nevadensis]|uniref:uncharacterized protein LOC110834119 n=1 Tax=Zootermopsis nevadensis TaxID=136037 RepID=UPI000B8E7ABB|nr:uncharacterized protein LOC110834119 [Zootermopsis nevadensis]